MKKFLSVFLALTFIFSACANFSLLDFSDLGVKTQAANESDLIFTLDTNTDTYSVKCKTTAVGVVVIPETYNGKKVTTIAWKGFDNCVNVTEVKIPSSITKIGSRAFNSCEALKTIEIPATVTDIGAALFSCCTSLETAYIYANITVLQSIDWDGGGGEGTFSHCRKLKNVILPNTLEEIGNYTFTCCDALEHVNIPSSVRKIGYAAFESTAVLKNPNNWRNDVLILGDNFIKAKDTLSGNVVIPSNVKVIAGGAFEYCGKIKSVEIPQGVTCLGVDTFFGCDALTEVFIPSSVASISSLAFTDGSDRYITIYGEKGSVAEIFANKNNYKFIAEESTPFTFNLSDDGTYFSISSCNKNASGAVTVPSLHRGLPVERIESDALSNCSKITSIIIPDSVDFIGSSTFKNCTSLTEVTLGSGLTNVSYNAFENCTALKKVNINDMSAFCGIYFYNATANPLYYAHDLYLNGKPVTDLVIPEGTKALSNYNFANSSIKSAVIPGSIEEWYGAGTFSNCKSLKTVTFSEGFTEISAPDQYGLIDEFIGVFQDCTALETVNFPNSLKTVGWIAFKNCTKLNSISLSDNVNHIGEDAFINTGYYNNKANWTNGLLYVNNHLLATDKNISGAVTVREGTKTIANDCFSRTKITSVTLPDSLVYINTRAFNECSELVNVIGGKNVKAIGDYAFSYCGKLQKIALSQSLEYIGDEAFYNCSALNFTSLPNNIKYIGRNCFDQTAFFNNSANWKNNAIYLGKYLIGIHSNYAGALNVKAGTELIAAGLVAYRDEITSITLPNGLKYINSDAFSECSGIKGAIVIPDSVIEIGSGAFGGCLNVTSLTIGKGIKTVPSYCFYGLEKVTSIVVPEGVETIDFCAFEGCTNLQTIEIPATVKNIEKDILANCKKVTILGEKGTAIENYAVENKINFAEASKILPTPKMIRLSNIPQGVQIVWGKVADNVKYEVYKRGPGESKWKCIGTTDRNSYIDGDVSSGNFYRYTVKAVSGDKKSTTEDGIYTRYVATPKMKKLSNILGGVNVEWEKIPSATEYRIYRRTGGGSWTYLATVKGENTTSYVDKTAKTGVYWRYTVRAVQMGRYSHFEDGIYTKYVATPHMKKLTNLKSGIKVEWNKVPGADQYRIYRRCAGKSWTYLGTVKGENTTYFIDKKATKGTYWRYTVRAVDSGRYSSSESGKYIKR